MLMRPRRQQKRYIKWMIMSNFIILILGFSYLRYYSYDNNEKQEAFRLGQLNNYNERVNEDGRFMDTYLRRIKRFLKKRNVSILSYERTGDVDDDLLVEMEKEVVNLQQVEQQELFNISHGEELRNGCQQSCCWAEKRIRNFYNGENDRVPGIFDRLSSIDFKLLADIHYGNLPIPRGINLTKLTYDILPCLQNNTVIFVDTTDLRQFFRDFHEKITVNYILITGDSDFSCPLNLIRTHSSLFDQIFSGKTHILHWLAMNCNLGANQNWINSNLLTCIPQGISQWSNQRYYMHLVNGNDDSIRNTDLKTDDYWIFTSFNKKKRISSSRNLGFIVSWPFKKHFQMFLPTKSHRSMEILSSYSKK